MSIKPFKDSYYTLVSNKTQVEKGSWHWHPASDDIIQICTNIFSLWHHQQKNKIQNLIKFFILNYKTFPISWGFEHLSSSIGWWVTSVNQNGKSYLLWNLIFHPIFMFWAIILAPDMLARQSRSLKTLDDSLVSKKTWAKKWLAQGQITSAKKAQKHAPITTSPQSPKPNYF